MAFSDKHLNDGEEVVLDLHPHWYFLFPRGALLVILIGLWLLSLMVDGTARTVAQVAVGLGVLVALIWFVLRLIEWWSTQFVVTTERCIHRSGVLTKRGIEVPLDRIHTVFFNQTLLERFLRSGDIGIESAGENSQQTFSDIIGPLNVQRTIYQQIEEYENRRQDRLGRVVRGSTEPSTSVADEVQKLHELFESGALTREEFEAQKAKLLAE